MKRFVAGTAFFLAVGFAAWLGSAEKNPAPSNGISYPTGWQHWSLVAVSYRTDNHTIRAILGNDTAIRAVRSGKTNPWPDGTILAKIVWKEKALENWKAAMSPGRLVHVEFMFKDSKKYAKTYGWGWARWLGTEQKPFNKGPRSCISCHKPVKNRDWVFTDPAKLPE
ncbi:MAG TPA: cytochrome P460 [Bacteroidetes bacterium]|nr:cytochrome P460 [Bacteroidota bacterium]